MSEAEAQALTARGAGRWFREADQAAEGAAHNPFEPIAGLAGFARIRKRRDGACGFLSPDNRCRIHEELGGARKPLACRVFPYSFHPTPSAVIVTTSFGCPTIAANEGAALGTGAASHEIGSLRDEWFSTFRPPALPTVLVAGRPIDARSIHILRTHLLQLLDRTEGGARDLRANVRRMAMMLDDLTRVRVRRLADADFAEYVALTVPYAAASRAAVTRQAPSRVGRLLQRGFLFAAAAMRLRLARRGTSRLQLRLLNARLLLHFHGIGPAVGQVNLAHLRRASLDVNSPELQPAVAHYLRASLESIDAGDRSLTDTVAVAVSILNSACALAIMNAAATKQAVDADGFRQALVEANDLAHAMPHGLLGRLTTRLAGGVTALHVFGHGGPATAAD